MGDVLQIIGAFFVVVGAVFCVMGGIGVVRLPDFYSRCHGSGMTDSAGAGALLLGLMCFAEPLVAFKLLILVAFLWVSSAVSTHSLAKAAYSKGVRIENVPQKDWTIAPPPPPEPTLATADSGLIVPAAATELSPPAPGTEDGSGSAGADETAHATPDTDEEPA